LEGIRYGTEYLGSGTEGIGILDARVVLSVVGNDLRIFEEEAQGFSDFFLAGLVANLVEAGIEEAIGGAAGVDCHSSGTEGGLEQSTKVAEGEGADGVHEVSAVDEGKSFFGFEGERGEVFEGEGFFAG